VKWLFGLFGSTSDLSVWLTRILLYLHKSGVIEAATNLSDGHLARF